MNTAPLFAPKVAGFFFDEQRRWIPSRYKAMYGGRGSLKTWSFARAAIMLTCNRRVRIACAREYQSSIAESVHETLTSQIDLLELRYAFKVQQNRIVSRVTGSEMFFAGLKTDPRKFKSAENIDVLYIEEGESLSETSWEVVIPTIRKPGSEIWCGFNPNLPSDPTSQRFIENPHPLARIMRVNWRDNPWLSEELRQEKDYMAATDDDAYQHVWEGGYRKNSASQVLKGKFVARAFEPAADWNGPYFGLDFGFSQDPVAAVELWIHKNVLYVHREAWKIGLDIDKTPEYLDREIPAMRAHISRADNARPESISYLQRHGQPRMLACEKWPGSVEDGITHLRSYEQIVIHPRCAHALEEARLWSYKVDRLTGDVLAVLVDANNHIWDATRYALGPLIKAPPGAIAFYEQANAERLAAQQRK